MPTPGSGGAWTVGISDGGGNETSPIGDLTPVGNDWTTVAITVPLTPDAATGSLANYLDANGEMLITLTSANPDTTQVGQWVVGLMGWWASWWAGGWAGGLVGWWVTDAFLALQGSLIAGSYREIA